MGFPFFFWVPEGADVAMDLPGHGKFLVISGMVTWLQPQYLVLCIRGPKRADICPVMSPYKMGYLSLPYQEPLHVTIHMNPLRSGCGIEIPCWYPAPCMLT